MNDGLGGCVWERGGTGGSGVGKLDCMRVGIHRELTEETSERNGMLLKRQNSESVATAEY